jgi:hypothetical protein
MIRLIPFRKEHVDLLTDPKTEPGLYKTIQARKDYWIAMAASGTAFSAFNGDEFLGCGGIVIPWPGVAEGWIWALDSVSKLPLEVHLLVRRGMRLLEDWYDIKRLSVEVREDNVRGQRWVRALGFKYECHMKKRGPDGETHMLYARVRD